MEELISNLSKSLGFFCNHVETSCDALKQSIQRRPIPLDSASSIFIQCLNRRVTKVTADVNLLESMSFGTVSFEELLGHCNEVYKSNQTHLLQLQDRLKSFGYLPELEVDDEDEGCGLSTQFDSDSKDEFDVPSPVSVAQTFMKSLEEDPLLDESLNLKNLGLSDVCLATLASEDNDETNDRDMHFQETMKCYGDKLDMKDLCQRAAQIEGELEDEPKVVEPCGTMVKVLKDDYESLPSYMKSLAPWEDLLAAVEKINSGLSQKAKTKEYNYFHQDEIESLKLGHKARTYLLLLTRLKQLLVETIDGRISYRVL
ncbi:Methyl-CpG-binding domain protein 4 [Melia azedarach]|uniref:Methyl-CpG-binding domain protein 4 n=1 Tax=Melia azedarach TaxID=155640 RepID=A0ACC1X4A8_MELAZ|nr:Methyl-CpG-binding domain protein 4 [Melia azedarach]